MRHYHTRKAQNKAARRLAQDPGFWEDSFPWIQEAQDVQQFVRNAWRRKRIERLQARRWQSWVGGHATQAYPFSKERK